MAKNPTVFEQLNPFSYRSARGQVTNFPCTSMRVELVHDIAEHKYWGKDGASLEATGRAPMVFTASIPFTNGIVPGRNEKWGVLYPTEFRNFLKAAAERGTGKLTHPELGDIDVKCKVVGMEWSGDRRGGCDVEATWIEDRIDDLDSVNLYDASPVTLATLGALDLDAQLTSRDPAPPGLPEYKPDFAAMMRSIQAVGDTVSSLSTRGGGLVDQIHYRAGNVAASLTRARSATARSVRTIVRPDTTAAARSALGWPIRQSAARIQSATWDLRKKLLESGKPIVLYRVPRTATLAAISIDTGAKLGELISLNPAALRSPFVPTGTMVRYYAAA